MRSLATSFCTALPVIALFLFGGETLQDFAFALLDRHAVGHVLVGVHRRSAARALEGARAGVHDPLPADPRRSSATCPPYAVATAGAPVDVEPERQARRAASITAPQDPTQVSRDEFDDMVAQPRDRGRRRGQRRGAQAGGGRRRLAAGRRPRARGRAAAGQGGDPAAARGRRRRPDAGPATTRRRRSRATAGTGGLADGRARLGDDGPRPLALHDLHPRPLLGRDRRGVPRRACSASLLFGLAVNGFTVPGQADTDLLTALEAIPGALLGIAAVYFYGAQPGQRAALGGRPGRSPWRSAAAVLHAVWNLLLARAPDTDAATAAALAIGVGALRGPGAAAVGRRRLRLAVHRRLGGVRARLRDHAGGGAAARRPQRRLPAGARLGPRARARGQRGRASARRRPPGRWRGSSLVAAGVLAVRGLQRPDDPVVVALALACGACIAGYTIVDAHGLDHASALPYLWIVIALTAAGYLPLVAGARAARAAAAGRAALGDRRGGGALLRCLPARARRAAARRARPGRRGARDERRDRDRRSARSSCTSP